MHGESSSLGGGQPAQAAVDTSQQALVDSRSYGPTVHGDDQSTTGTFLHEIGAAMVAAAERERDRITRDLTEHLGAHLDDLRSRSSDEARELMRLAEADVDGIREWSAAEQERVRQETERRIEGRRAELERHLSQQDVALEREIATTADMIQAYRAELEGFVQRLAEEPDPTEIARRASQLPPPPRLEDVAAAARERVITEAETRRDRESGSEVVSGGESLGSQSTSDLVGVMDPGLTSRVPVSTGEMVGASRPAVFATPPDGVAESPVSIAAEAVDDETQPEAASRAGWTDVALRFLPLILLVAIAAAVAYLLISGRANGLGG